MSDNIQAITALIQTWLTTGSDGYQALEELTIRLRAGRWTPTQDEIAQFVAVYLDEERDRDLRLSALSFVGELDPTIVEREVETSVWFSSEAIHDAEDLGDNTLLDAEIDRKVPDHRAVNSVRSAVERVLGGQVRSDAQYEAELQGVPAEAVEWLDDPDAVPDRYYVTGHCATCSSFLPREIADGTVLGECSVHSAKQGMFGHDASCDQWSERDEE